MKFFQRAVIVHLEIGEREGLIKLLVGLGFARFFGLKRLKIFPCFGVILGRVVSCARSEASQEHSPSKFKICPAAENLDFGGVTDGINIMFFRIKLRVDPLHKVAYRPFFSRNSLPNATSVSRARG